MKKLKNALQQSLCWYALTFLAKEARLVLLDDCFDMFKHTMRVGLRLLFVGVILKEIEGSFLLRFLQENVTLLGGIALAFGIIVSQIELAVQVKRRIVSQLGGAKLDDMIVKKTLEFDLDTRMSPDFKERRRSADRCNFHDMEAMGLFPIQVCFATTECLAFLVGLTWLNWKIALALLALGVAVFLFGRKLNRETHEMDKKSNRITERVWEYRHSVINNQSTLLGFSLFFLGKLQRWRSEMFALTVENMKKNNKTSAILGIFSLVAGVVCVYYLARSIKLSEGIFQIGMTMATAQGALNAVRDLGRNLTAYSKFSVQIRDFRNFIEAPSDNGEKLDTPITTRPGANLRVENLKFSYPEGEKPALSGITLTFEPGVSTVIVGKNGSGKSTLLCAITQLFRSQSGNVFLDGVRLNNYRTTRCVEVITFIPQKGDLPEIPIIEGVFGRNSQHELECERLTKALKWSGADRVMPQLKKGLLTPFGHVFDDGQGLSGGQEQRLRLAAFLYHAQSPEVRVLLADEPSRYLDAESRANLYRAMREIAKLGKIVIVVAHDAELTNFDRVILLDEGKVSQDLKGQDKITKSVDAIAKLLAGDTE